MQRAQPVLLSHHFLAYAEMLIRDRDRFLWAASQADVCPLGSGACAGNQFGIDREFIAGTLGFASVTHNSMDAVSDRDFVCDFLHAALLCAVHLSRFSEDLILWSTAEFALATLDDSVTTGSSLLPQKKNPDACELTRGKCGRILGHLVALATVLKGLPLTYNRDLQEDKEGVFDAVDTLETVIPVFRVLIETMSIRPEGAAALLRGGHLGALGLADHLTRRGVPFREAHRVAGAAVRLAEERGVGLPDLPLEEYRRLHGSFDDGLYAAMATEAMLADKLVTGGTAPERVREEILRLRGMLDASRGS
jgi:argininosuccinate lyase